MSDLMRQRDGSSKVMTFEELEVTVKGASLSLGCFGVGGAFCFHATREGHDLSGVEMFGLRTSLLTENREGGKDLLHISTGTVLFAIGSSSHDDVLRGLRAQAVALITHEIDEKFRFKGARVFDPHAPIFYKREKCVKKRTRNRGVSRKKK